MIRGVARFGFAIGLLFALGPHPADAQGDMCLNSDGPAAIAACQDMLSGTSGLTPSETAAHRRAYAAHLLGAGEFARALAALDQLAEFDDASVMHHFERARALAGLDREEEARAALDQALTLDPLHVEALMMRAGMALDGGDADTSLADAGLAATLAPDNPKANALMADALAAIGASDAAARSAEVAEANVAPETNPEAAAPKTDVVDTKEDTTSALELTFWNDVKDSDTPEELAAFIAAFPNSVFVPLAQLRLKRLEGGASQVETAAIAEPAPTPRASIAPTQPLSLRIGDKGENLAWRSLHLPSGDFVIAGGLAETGADREKPWLSRYRADGTEVWQLQERSQAKFAAFNDVVLLKNGTLMAVAALPVDDGAVAVFSVVIVSPEGAVMSRRQVEGKSSQFIPVGLIALSDGGALLTTGVTLSDARRAALILKLDSGGGEVWRQEITAGSTTAAWRAAEAGGAIFVVGNTSEGEDADESVWLHKYAVDGTLVWQRPLAVAKAAHAGGVAVQSNGHVLILTNKDNTFLITRMDADGNVIKETEMNVGTRDSVYNLVVFPDDSFAAAGTAQTADYTDGSVGWIVWFNAQGQEIARRVMGDRVQEFIVGLSPTGDDGVIVTGQFAPDNLSDRAALIEVIPPLSRIDPDLLQPEGSGVMHACVERAAHPGDLANPYGQMGVSWDDFDAETAKGPCNLAVSLYPGNAAVRFHHGRTLHKLEDFAGAATSYEFAAETGHVRAMVGRAVLYFDGPDEMRDEARGITLLEDAYLENDPIAAAMLAERYASGRGVAKDLGRAFQAYKLAAAAGMQGAQYALARHYRYGWGVEKHPRKAVRLYEAAVTSGHVEAKGELAYILHYGAGVPKQIYRAKDLFREAAEAGHAGSILHVADAYRWGNDAQVRNRKLAAKWYQKAIDAGAPEAFGSLGFMYEMGQGVPEDLAKAISLYRQGVAEGQSNAEFNLGYAYNFGAGVEENFSEAARLYKLAAEDGHSGAMVELAYLHREGKGTAKDAKAAYRLFRKGGDEGNLRGIRESGWMMFTGKGTKKDVGAAIARIKKAAREDDALAKVYLGFIFETEESVKRPRRAARYYYEGLQGGEDWPTTREAKNWDRATARNLQKMLKEGGFYTGAIDGSIGPASVRAMKALCKCG